MTELHKWERVDENHYNTSGARNDEYTDRMRVPGGWLYRYNNNFEIYSMCFVPDSDGVGQKVVSSPDTETGKMNAT